MNKIKQKRHGHTGFNGAYMSPTYITWTSMKQRCYNKKHSAHDRYKGINVCNRWKNSFINFLKDMGERPAGKTLDRIDNSGDYTPENCRWATRKQQANNTKKNIKIKVGDTYKNINQLSKEYNLSKKTIYSRIKAGWTTNQILGLEPRRKKTVDIDFPEETSTEYIVKKLRDEGYTYETIGRYLGLSRQRIEQIHRRPFKYLRRKQRPLE